MFSDHVTLVTDDSKLVSRAHTFIDVLWPMHIKSKRIFIQGTVDLGPQSTIASISSFPGFSVYRPGRVRPERGTSEVCSWAIHEPNMYKHWEGQAEDVPGGV